MDLAIVRMHTYCTNYKGAKYGRECRKESYLFEGNCDFFLSLFTSYKYKCVNKLHNQERQPIGD
jgi:hypothetical protein